jgi:hypothetical protein
MPLLHRQMLDVLGVKNAQKLIPMHDDVKPKDPITENMDAFVGKPLKAFIYQDHEAHIASHMNFLQDPQTAAMMGQNPQAQQIMAGLQAHIGEHFGFKYRQQIEQQLGAPLPYLKEDDDTLPEEYEVQLSRLVAQASTQLLQQNQQAAAQQQAQEMAEDPIVQMQKEELAIKSGDLQRKVLKDKQDAEFRARQLAIEEQRTMGQLEIEGTKLGMNAAKEKDKLQSSQELEGTRLGIEMMDKVAKNKIAISQKRNKQ